MDLKNFDKNIKSALDNIEESYDSASWLDLEKRMNAAFTEEQPAPVAPVDLVAKRALERLEMPFQVADWNLLNARLNANALAQRIRYTKLAELAILLLLLLNIEGFLGGFKEVVRPKAPQPAKSTMPMAASPSKKNGKNLTHSKDASKIGALAEHALAILASPFQKAVQPETISSPQFITIPMDASVLDAQHFYSTSGLIPFHKIAPIPHVKAPDFAWQTLFEVIPGVQVPATPKSSGLYAASYASYDRNFVKNNGNSRKNVGYGGGIAVGYRHGKWGIESGLAYAHKDFSPKKDVNYYAGNQIDGMLGAYVKQVDADVFSIPIKATRRIARFGKTTAHAVAGIAASVATEKRFTYKIVKTAPTSPDPTTGPNPSQYPIPKVNNDGLFEGGSLKTNAYATADIGIRVEHPLGKRYVAFVEPSYRQSIGGGFGPKQERISTFSFQAGVMAAL